MAAQRGLDSRAVLERDPQCVTFRIMDAKGGSVRAEVGFAQAALPSFLASSHSPSPRLPSPR